MTDRTFIFYIEARQPVVIAEVKPAVQDHGMSPGVVAGFGEAELAAHFKPILRRFQQAHPSSSHFEVLVLGERGRRAVGR